MMNSELGTHKSNKGHSFNPFKIYYIILMVFTDTV